MVRILVLALAVSAAAPVASAYTVEPSGTAVAAADPSTPRQLESAVSAERRILTASEPVTVALDTADGTILRTGFSGLSTDGAPSVRAYVGLSGADLDTPFDDPHYAGTVAFYPVPQDGTFTSTLNLTQVLERTGQSGPVSVTYVMNAPRDADTSVEISEAALVPAP